jgi:ABC-type sulfate/molybdate transport systems ATPase subunit
VDIPGIPVTEEKLAVTHEEEEIVKEIESVLAENTGSVEKNQEEIEADNVKIKKAAEEAAAQPDVVQPAQMQPKEVEPTPAEPTKNTDGYVYTKEKTVKNIVTAFQNKIDTGARAYVGALEEAKSRAEIDGKEFDQAAFDADLNQLLTDPYSSSLLTPYLEHYRKFGEIDLLNVFSSEWLSIGGDDGEWAERRAK